jgi:hypothetical protein
MSRRATAGPTVRIAHHWGRFRATRRDCHVALVMGFAWGRRPHLGRSRLLDSRQPDESRAPHFVGSSARNFRAGSARAACSSARRPETRAPVGSRPYCAGGRARASASGRTGGHSPARCRSDCSHACSRCRTASRRAARSRAAVSSRRAGASSIFCERVATWRRILGFQLQLRQKGYDVRTYGRFDQLVAAGEADA